MIHNVEDARRQAKRRLPKAIYEFVAGGAEDEITLNANRTGFDRWEFRPRALIDVAVRDTSIDLFGDRITMPLLLDPTGLTRVISRAGELDVARGAGAAGTIYTLGIGASQSIEDIAAVASGPLWLQVYIWRDRELVESIVERARLAGCRALCMTIDVPVYGNRERDARNGMTIPPRINVANFWDSALRPRWLRDQLFGDHLTFKNLQGIAPGDDAVAIGTYLERELYKPSSDWRDLAWLRELWDGPLLVKGIMTADDALRAAEYGADGVVVSNHGGRQLDGLPGTIDALPEVVAAAGDRMKILMDGGVRRGTDVVKALALGATACMVGRPYLWGLAAGGAKGVEQVLDIFRQEIDRTLALLGACTVDDVDRTLIRYAGST
jgi:L-lactate dehydrogenase (cytochrome)